MATHRSTETPAPTIRVEDKLYVDMTLDELEEARVELHAEMLDIDGALALRRTRPSGNGSVQPMYNYMEWRNEQIARKNQITIDYQLVKSLILEKRHESRAAARTNNRDAAWWQRRAGWLQRALEAIGYDPEASASTKSRAADVLLKLNEHSLGVVDEEDADAAD